jgi:hypothetical protein
MTLAIETGLAAPVVASPVSSSDACSVGMCLSVSTHPSTAFALFAPGSNYNVHAGHAHMVLTLVHPQMQHNRRLSTKLIKLFTSSTLLHRYLAFLVLEAMYEIHGGCCFLISYLIW